MSVATLTMPRLGETMEQGEVVGWLVEVGQRFARGDAILEVETDKTVVEYPALGAGVLVEVLAGTGDIVDVGAPIARIDLGEGVDWTGAGAETPVGAGVTDGVEPPAKSAPPRPEGARLRATPVARRLARREDVDLTGITGTGRRGRIEASDVSDAAGGAGRVRFAHGIAYVDSGPRSSPAFLLLHGFGGDHTTFALLVNGLSQANARVVACDLPGHGATGIEAATAAELATNLGEFARTIMGNKPFHLVAHSLGTAPALSLAQGCDLASLTLIAPVGLAPAHNAAFLSGMAKPDTPAHVKQLVNSLTNEPGRLSETAISDIFAEQSRGRLVGLAAALGAKQTPITSALAELARSTVIRVLVGDNDRIVGHADTSALPPEVALHQFRQTGHMPHWENPGAVLNIVLAGR